jgi:hypothetical protein
MLRKQVKTLLSWKLNEIFPYSRYIKKKYIANFAVQQGTNDQSYQTLVGWLVLGIKSYRKWFLAHKERGSVEMA